MNALLEDARWRACMSAFQLDRWRLGELTATEAAAVQSHVDGCARCREALEALAAAEADHRASALPLRSLAAARVPEEAPPARRTPRWLVPAGAVALAAGLLLAVRPDAGVRSKGHPVALGMYVQHGGEVRRAAPGEAVAPGDTVRFTYSAPERRSLAILSVDGAGMVTVYFPDGPETVAVEAAQDAPLPLGTQLDGVLGEERVVGLFCDRPRALEPLRQLLQAGGAALSEVPGCELATFRFVKRAP